jgi:hypothetical protein
MKAKSFMRQPLSVGAFAGDYHNPLPAAAVSCTEKSSNLHRVGGFLKLRRNGQKAELFIIGLQDFSGMVPKYIMLRMLTI